MPRALAILGLGLACLAAPGRAGAQELVLDREDAVPFAFEGVALNPVIENDAVTFKARDVSTGRQRAVRVDATGATAVPSEGVADIAVCRGQRWLLRYESRDNRGRYWLHAAGAAPIWSREVSLDAFVRVRLECVGTSPILGTFENGELILTTPTRRGSPSTRIGLLPPGQRGSVDWRQSPSGVIFAAIGRSGPDQAELVRIAGGAITHRVSLGVAADPRVWWTPDRVLVARSGPHPHAVLSSFAPGDLAAEAEIRVPRIRPQARLHVHWLAPGPVGRVVVALTESWHDGPDVIRIPVGSRIPEPAQYTATYLVVWTPLIGTVGPPLDLGPAPNQNGAWLGDRFILVSPVSRAGVAGVPQSQARLRRYRVR